MTCREARERMHEVLDGTAERAALDDHLEACLSCASEFRSLCAAAEAVGAVVSRAPDPAALDRVSAGVERALLSDPLPTGRPAPLRWAGAVTCLAAVFALGTLTGRSAWPRTVEVTRVVETPTVVEKVVEVPVEVPVEVIRERIVERRVPVTRVVYHDRPSHEEELGVAQTVPQALDDGVRVVTGGGEDGQLPWTATIGPRTSVPVVSYEVRPATIARNADASGADEAGEDTIGAEASASTTQACAYTGAEEHGRDDL